MKKMTPLAAAIATTLVGLISTDASAQIFITEFAAGTGKTPVFAADTYGLKEYVEFTNIGSVPVDMTGWSEDDSTRTPNKLQHSLSAIGIVQPGESFIFTESDPEEFRTFWGLAPTVKILGPYFNDNLSSSGDEINLYDNTYTTTGVASSTYSDRIAYFGNNASYGDPGTTGNGVGRVTPFAQINQNNNFALVNSSPGDKFGTFRAPGSLQPGAEGDPVPIYGSPSVNSLGSIWGDSTLGTWSTPASWVHGVPAGPDAVASFTSGSSSAAVTVLVDGGKTVGTLNFRNSNGYLLSGGSIALDVVSGSAEINANLGSHVVTSPITVNDNLVVTTTAGSSVLLTGGVSAAGKTITKFGNGTLGLSTGSSAAISVQEGAVIVSGTVKTDALTIAGTPAAPTAKVDLVLGGALVLNYTTASPLADAKTLITSGKGTTVPAFATFAYDGLGITSTAAGAANAIAKFDKYVVVAIENSALGANAYTSFGTLGIDGTAVIVRATYAGDANLDGRIDAKDYAIINASFVSQNTSGGYASGDFNGDSIINADDYAIIDFGKLNQGTALAFGDAVAVPEPSTFALTAAGMSALLRRSRRSSSSKPFAEKTV